jgi:hypothetical protein
MKWFRKSLLCASIGCLGASASAQEVVTLGRPTPLPIGQANEVRVVNAFVPIQPRPSVVRACGQSADDEVKVPALPRELPPLNQSAPSISTDGATAPIQPVQASSKDKAQVVEPDKKSQPAAACASCGSVEVVPEQRGSGIFDWSFAGRDRFYVGAEYLLWWTRGMHLPPLVTTAPATDPEATRAALGFGGTQILYGNNTTSSGPTSGARFTLGYNLDDCGLFAVEANYFFLGRNSDNALFSSSQFPVLGRPFFDINDGVQSRQLTASPGTNPGDVFKAAGSIGVNTSTDLQGAELNLRALLWCGCNFNVTGLVGFRYLNLDDSLSITEHGLILKSVPTNPPNVPLNAGDQFIVSDQFHTRNQFFGGQLGVIGDWYFGRWFVEGGLKIGLGDTLQSVDIDGYQRIISPTGGVQTFKGGLYAVSSNIGHFSQSRFGFVPDANLKLGYNLTDNIRLFVGYDFLYWSSVLRAGDQIDQALDLNRVPNSGAPFPAATQVRPIVPFRTSSYWATGVNAGVEFRY